MSKEVLYTCTCNFDIFCATVHAYYWWSCSNLSQAIEIIFCYNSRIIIWSTNLEPHTPAETINAPVYTKAIRFQFVVSVNVPQVVRPLSFILSSPQSVSAVERHLLDQWFLERVVQFHGLLSSCGYSVTFATFHDNQYSYHFLRFPFQ